MITFAVHPSRVPGRGLQAAPAAKGHSESADEDPPPVALPGPLQPHLVQAEGRPHRGQCRTAGVASQSKSKVYIEYILKFQTKTNDQDTLDAFLANDEASTYCQDLPNMLKVKHAVDLFINVIIRN